jgi:hypothetical protein
MFSNLAKKIVSRNKSPFKFYVIQKKKYTNKKILAEGFSKNIDQRERSPCKSGKATESY